MKKMTQCIRLYCPRLCESADFDADLNRLRHCARKKYLPHAIPEKHLLEWLGLHSSSGIPAATFSAPFEPLPAQQYWMRADPVHWEVTMDGIYMMPPEVLKISRQEAEALKLEINSLIQKDDLVLYAPHPYRWYLSLPKRAQIETSPLSQTVGAEISRYIFSGPEADQWRAWLTEIQMMLEQSTVNQQRIANGHPSINSLWLWGEGYTFDVRSKQTWHVLGCDPFAQGLAHQAKHIYSDLEENYNKLTTQAPFICLVYPPIDRDHDWEAFKMNWLMPITRDFKQGHMKQLEIYLGEDTVYTLKSTVWTRWRSVFSRRRKL